MSDSVLLLHVTPEMIEAGKGALLTMLRAPNHTGELLDYALTVEQIYLAMLAARPIAQQRVLGNEPETVSG